MTKVTCNFELCRFNKNFECIKTEIIIDNLDNYIGECLNYED